MHLRRQRKFKRRRRRRNVLVSTLDIFDVSQTDGGVYTCAPSNAKNHSVMVHVVKGMIHFFLLYRNVELVYIHILGKVSYVERYAM